MKKMLFFFMVSANTLFAGTAGNSDVSIIYGFFMIVLVIMIGVDFTLKYIKKRKEIMPEESLLDDSDGLN